MRGRGQLNATLKPSLSRGFYIKNMQKTYTFNRKDKETGEVTVEQVPLERWVWGVVYQDGTELHQFMADGTFHQIGEIDQDKVKMFCLYKPEDPTKRIDMPVRKGMKIIYKYKMTKPFYLNDFVRIYCLGYKDGRHHHFTFILPDDRMIVSNHEDVDLVQFDLTKN